MDARRFIILQREFFWAGIARPDFVPRRIRRGVAAAPNRVERRVACDDEEPTRERSVGMEIGEPIIRAQERNLCDIFGFVGVVREAIGEAHDRRAVALDEHFECVVRPGACRVDERAIRRVYHCTPGGRTGPTPTTRPLRHAKKTHPRNRTGAASM